MRHFTCACCGGKFEVEDPEWTEEAAKAEAAHYFPGLDITDVSQRAVVCSDCYDEIMQFYERKRDWKHDTRPL